MYYPGFNFNFNLKFDSNSKFNSNFNFNFSFIYNFNYLRSNVQRVLPRLQAELLAWILISLPLFSSSTTSYTSSTT